MATKEREYGYFPHSYFGASYFPAVWFAPAFDVLEEDEEERVVPYPGNRKEEKRKSSPRDFDFLDPEYHKQRIAPKAKRIIAKIAKQATKADVKATQESQESPVASEYLDSLIASLERENIAFKRFYADLLEQQIEAQRLAQIRLQFELMGLYEQVRQQEEDDEQAIMMLMLEM